MDLTNNLIRVLIRFRQKEVALVAHVEVMVYQVRVSPDDCDSLRFLWWSGGFGNPFKEHQMLVHIFGAVSCCCCSNKVRRQTADDNADTYGKKIAEVVHRNFYVDDLKSIGTVNEGIELALKLIDLLREGGFHLTKFLSNRREVIQAIPATERDNPTRDLEKQGWDDDIQGRQVAVWQRWIQSLPCLTGIHIPRCYRDPNMVECVI